MTEREFHLSPKLFQPSNSQATETAPNYRVTIRCASQRSGVNRGNAQLKKPNAQSSKTIGMGIPINQSKIPFPIVLILCCRDAAHRRWQVGTNCWNFFSHIWFHRAENRETIRATTASPPPRPALSGRASRSGADMNRNLDCVACPSHGLDQLGPPPAGIELARFDRRHRNAHGNLFHRFLLITDELDGLPCSGASSSIGRIRCHLSGLLGTNDGFPR